MIRAVLVGWSEDDWKLYRQTQWMAEVRRSPDAALRPRRHFDMTEDAYLKALESWVQEGAGKGLSAASKLLDRLGAIDITPS